MSLKNNVDNLERDLISAFRAVIEASGAKVTEKSETVIAEMSKKISAAIYKFALTAKVTVDVSTTGTAIEHTGKGTGKLE